MKENYDLLILNNCPSFYKVNLYNEIAKKNKIFVVFLGYFDQVVIDKDFKNKICFGYEILNDTEIGKRNFVSSYFKLRKILKRSHFINFIYGGYIEPEFILLSFLRPKHKNILQTESAGETKISGWRYYLKKILLKRYSKAIASGGIHLEMLAKMGFTGEIVVSKGVGLLNKSEILIERQPKGNGENLKYLYVGRLISLKNIELLINTFNSNKKLLTIVGKGSLENELKIKANSNITFKGFINNRDISKIYNQHDVFILASFTEAWGLVVEEALYNGCILLLSDRIGSKRELLEQPNTGCIFDPESEESLNAAIEKIEADYLYYYSNVLNFEIDKKDEWQVQSYLQLIN